MKKFINYLRKNVMAWLCLGVITFTILATHTVNPYLIAIYIMFGISCIGFMIVHIIAQEYYDV